MTDPAASDSPQRFPIGTRQSPIGNHSGNPLAWALYLGMSWTWIIGMYLPVLLVRDYGLTAWIIFAIPNCLGAAAMGWVMRSRRASVDLTSQHALACRIFSLVTIAFHLFVVTWKLPQLVGNIAWITPIVLVQIAFTPMLRKRGALLSCLVVFLISASIAIALWTTGALELPKVQTARLGDLLGLSFVCTVGFLLCPYLDLTFHRARQSTTDSGARIAFGVGFCFFFASMIVLTLFYARGINTLAVQSVAAWLIYVHISVQAILTVALHSAVAYDQAEAGDDVATYRSALGCALGVGLAGAMLAYFFNSHGVTYAGFDDFGEIVYRLFLSFYGLIAPAYALTSFRQKRPNWRWTAIAIGLAMPFYWIAFIERHMAWALVGGALLLLAGVVASRRRTSPSFLPSRQK